MAENILKEPVRVKKKGATIKGVGFFKTLMDGSFLTFDRSPGLFPFLLYVTVMAIFLIANTYYAEKKVREIEKLRAQVTESRTIYISNKSELMYLSNQSDVARRLASRGFVESTVPPRILPNSNPRAGFIYKILEWQKK